MKRSTDKKQQTKENQHIPRYIKTQPWYYKDGNAKPEGKDDEDYLKHHRNKDHTLDHNDEPSIGAGISDKFITTETKTLKTTMSDNGDVRKCTNCGTMGHLAKDCFERPKKFKKLDSYSGDQIKIRNDEELDWDAKKDRWFGYEGKEYNELLQNWENKKKNELKMPSNGENEVNIWDSDEEIELMKLGLYKDSVGLLKKDDYNNTHLKNRTSVRLREDLSLIHI